MKKIYIISLLLITLSSCTRDRAQALIGYWELIEAQRAGNPTSLLDGLFFEFNPDKTLQTNLFGINGKYSYEVVDEESIRLLGTEEELLFDYKVNENILNLSMNINKTKLSLKMTKK